MNNAAKPAIQPTKTQPVPAKPGPKSPAAVASNPPARHAPAQVAAVPSPVGLAQRTRSLPRKRRGTALISFLLLVVVPVALVAWYYAVIASPQYESELRFAVRGTETSALSALGFTALPGSTTQGADAYIVTDYIHSLQLLTDMRTEQGIDLRTFYASEDIDPLYRIDADMPMEEFLGYWKWISTTDYNSTTSITTFQVNAFSSEDAAKISSAVLSAAAALVNQLSTEAREQLIATAQTEVERTEERLTKARTLTTAFRNREQSLDPKLEAEAEQTLTTGLQKELIDLRARRSALLATVNATSPSVRVIDRQIRAVQTQLDAQKRNVGSGAGGNAEDRNLSLVLNDYSTLLLEQEFAEKAYTSALSSLETSQAEARKQERYFAIVVKPTEPSVALYPLRITNTLIAFAVFFLIWLLVYLVAQSVRDHAV